jgi:RNA polymerase sigma factor (sigma-70 family)
MQLLQQIIAGCQVGNPRSQTALYNKFHAAMRHTCLKVLKDPDAADDCLQAGYLKIFTAIGQIDIDINESQFAAWQHRIMRNVCIDALRSKARRPAVPLSDTYEIADDAEPYDGSIDDEYAAVMQLVPHLSAGYRDVFELRAGGMKHEAIAMALNISISTSKSNFHKAKDRLLKLYEKKVTKPVGAH